MEKTFKTTGKQVTMLSNPYRRLKVDVKLQLAKNIESGTSIGTGDLMKVLFEINPVIDYILGTNYALIADHDNLMRVLDRFKDSDRKILA